MGPSTASGLQIRMVAFLPLGFHIINRLTGFLQQRMMATWINVGNQDAQKGASAQLYFPPVDESKPQPKTPKLDRHQSKDHHPG